MLFVFGDVEAVALGFVWASEEDGVTGEAVGDGVEFGFCLTLGSGRTVGFLGVLAVSGETGF